MIPFEVFTTRFNTRCQIMTAHAWWLCHGLASATQ